MGVADADGEPRGFEPIEHTADLGLRVWAESIEGLFEQAALGALEFLVDPGGVGERTSIDVEVEGEDAEESLVAWLQEILYLVEVRRFIPARVSVMRAGAGGVTARVWGEPYDPARHQRRTDIKAATYHDLRIRKETISADRDRWECTIVLDT